MIIDIHHDGRIESHPYRIRELTADGWALVLNFAGQPRKFRSMQEAADWAKERQDYGTALNGWEAKPLTVSVEA